VNRLAADNYTDFSGFARLRADAREGGADARKEVATQMEAMFVSLMLKSMREAGAAFGNAGGAGMERDLYDSQLAMNLARNGRLGFADTMLREIDPAGPDAGAGPRAFPAPPRNPALPARDWLAVREAAGAPVSNAAGVDEVRAADAGTESVKPAHWDSPEAFARALWPAASRAAQELGTRPEAVLAVAALETGWGRHMPQRENGTSSNNLFGIKAHGWSGDVTHSATLEFQQGAFARKLEPFRAYDSPEAAVADFAHFVKSNPRYREALASGGDAVKFVRELHRAGYATDPRYGDKLEALINSAPLQSAAAAADTMSA